MDMLAASFMMSQRQHMIKFLLVLIYLGESLDAAASLAFFDFIFPSGRYELADGIISPRLTEFARLFCQRHLLHREMFDESLLGNLDSVSRYFNCRNPSACAVRVITKLQASW